MRSAFDLNLLAVAVAVHEERSVTRAAAKLDRSQPSISVALKRLRETLGDPLFVKTATGMEPTQCANNLVAEAREMLRRLDDRVLAQIPFDPGVSKMTLSIALSDVGEMVFLPRIIERVKILAPSACVRSVSAPPPDLQAGLERGDIDLAVGYFPDLIGRSFMQQRLFNHHFVCLLRVDHPTSSERLTLDTFLELEHAVVHAEGRSQEILERYLIAKKIKRKVALITPHFMSLPMIIARSDLLATVPHAVGMHFAGPASGIKALRPPFDVPPIELKQHWHRRFQNDTRHRWLRRLIRELFSTETDEWRAAREA